MCNCLTNARSFLAVLSGDKCLLRYRPIQQVFTKQARNYTAGYSYVVKCFVAILVLHKYVTSLCNVKMHRIVKTAPRFRFATKVLLTFITALTFRTLPFWKFFLHSSLPPLQLHSLCSVTNACNEVCSIKWHRLLLHEKSSKKNVFRQMLRIGKNH